MNIAEQLDAVSGTNRLVLVEFYADWSPHYEWLEPVGQGSGRFVQYRDSPGFYSLAARARIVETSGRTDHR